MVWKWFVQKDDVIEGPLNTEDVQTRLQVGQLSSHHLIWGRGLDQWKNLHTWASELAGLTMSGHQEHVPQAWHYTLGGQARGPMLREILINELKALTSLADVMVWTKGMKEWAPLFEFHDILVDIGVNKRQFPRADLTGKAVLKTSSSTFAAPLLSISEGGFGISLESGLTPGEILSVEIQSPAFREALHAKAEVRYLGQGVAGMKFTHLNVESRGAIIQFIRQNQMRFMLKAA